jgi:hypothetical protein
MSVPVATLPGVDEVATLIAEAIVASDHPQVASVQVDPSGPAGWCRVKVGFADGSTAFIGTSR